MSDASKLNPTFSLACETVLSFPSERDDADQIESVDAIETEVQAALANPTNYPSIADSIVPGDHVVLAVDPSVPELRRVIAGVVLALGETEVGQIDAVLWDEASDEQIAMISEEMGPSSKVVRHHGDLRRDVRYLAADESADPIYVNRLLVDADFVLPIASGRFGFDHETHDCTGIYPMLVDSASRKRFVSGSAGEVPASQTRWLLGVQMMLSVAPERENRVRRILAGAIGWIDEQYSEMAETELPSRELPSLELSSLELPSLGQADLVVAVLEQGTPQTWQNATRAIQAAAAIASEDATIVLWSGITEPIPAVSPDAVDDAFDEDQIDTQAENNDSENSDSENNDSEEDFPAWNADMVVARELAELSSRYRLLIRSELDSEAVELAGFGAISDADQLSRLSQGFDVGCVLRRASCLAPAATQTGRFRLEN
ncbi:hypothetical protein LF1_50450 [Rubripirellula obstinata]|uniref:Uncharacterized protein n=1 Tax=Rubripirellula obstinata TaxID=406547 RepID=A0A5B1CS35_9BACT|nr:lactate racemase domain-containing protein [Rubripirellula obstinata]KAA1262480.1 hypothetical protein LF1_50450 [Rubripirellula obstinata]